MLAPIIVPVYDRSEHLKKCIESLQKNSLAKDSILYIVSDAAYKKEHEEKINKVREYASTVSGFKEVRLLFRKTNMGEADSLGAALSDIYKWSDRFILLEDDIIVSIDFLRYMNDGLDYYKDDPQIMAICGFRTMFKLPKGYNQDVYFYPCNSPWGFASWKNKWTKIDSKYYDRYSELKKDSKRFKEFTSIGFYVKGILQADSRKEIVAGDVRAYYHMFQNHMCSVFPVVSKTQNWGFDGTGEHCDNKKAWWAKPPLDTRNASTRFIPFIEYNNELLKNHRRFQDKINGGILAKYLKYTWIHRLWKKLKKHL